MKLKDAIILYKKEEGAISNSYDWYRKSAQKPGYIPISESYVPVFKKGGQWYTDNNKFQEAIKNHRVYRKHLKQVTEDYKKGIIHGKDNEIFYTEWGGYKIHGGFRFVWSNYERGLKKYYRTWCCNRCNIIAKTEHSKEECHLCKDWDGCGRDCTLSKIYCPKCCTSLNI
ncbi:hypothetical protein ES703_96262 [subsurface metagenome]